MKSKIEEKLSLSHLSRACIYYFLFRILQFYFLKIDMILVLVILVTIFQLLRYKRLYPLSMGGCLILLHLSITCLNSSQQLNSYLTQTEAEEIFRGKESIVVQFDHSIKNKFYHVSISTKELEKKAILYYSNRLHKLPTYKCEKNSITIIREEKESPFLEFLNRYGSFYLKLKNCEIVKESYNLAMDTKHRIEILLKKSSLNPSSREIAMGLIFGDLSYVNREFKNASKEGGMIHLFAASGLHLGIILGFLAILMEKGFRLNFYLSRIIPLLLGFIYLYLLGFPISLSRAYFFACFWVLTKITFRKSNPMNMILICTAFISIFQNDQFLSIGFCLSLGAVVGIFYLKDILDCLLFSEYKNFFTENFTVSLSAGLGTYPFLIYFFQSFSYGSLLLNLILVPIASFTLPILFLSVALNLLEIPLIGELLWILSDILLRSIISLTIFLSENYSFYRVYEESTSMLYGYYIWLLIFFLFMKYFSYETFSFKNFLFVHPKKIESISHSYQSIFMNIDILKENQTILLFEPSLKVTLNKIKSIKLNVLMVLKNISVFSVILTFYVFGYNHSMKDNKTIQPIFKVGINSYAIETNASLFIEGDCKYFGKSLRTYENKNHCTSLIDAHITHLSCLSFLKKCGLKSVIFLHPSFLKANSSLTVPKNFDKEFPEVKISSEKIQRLFSSNGILFYAPHLEGVYPISNLPKNKKGMIILQLPFQSKDNSKEWNDNRNLLFIPDTWKFYTYNEL